MNSAEHVPSVDPLSLVESGESDDRSFRGRRRGDRTRARLLLSFALGTAIAGFPLCLICWLLLEAALQAAVIALGFVLMVATWPVLRLSGRLDAASNWASFALFCTVVSSLPLSGGLASPALPWIVLVPVFALVFCGRRSGLFWGLLAAAAVVVLYVPAVHDGFVSNQFTAPDMRLLTPASTLLLMALTTTLFFMYRRYTGVLFDTAANFETEASVDPLTELRNRRDFERQLMDRLRRARRDRRPLAVGMIDLDDFKEVNDNYGHAVGDSALVEATRRLTAVLRDEDLLSRFGGDEFAVLFDRAGTVQDLQTIGRRLASLRDEPFELEGRELEIDWSIGIAVIDRDQLRLLEPETARERLLQTADTAMYQSKKQSEDFCLEKLTPDSGPRSDP